MFFSVIFKRNIKIHDILKINKYCKTEFIQIIIILFFNIFKTLLSSNICLFHINYIIKQINDNKYNM